jgi:hypothetical protein
MPRWDNDPAYLAAKAEFKRLRPPCARCGGDIDYDSPRYYTDATGRRRENLLALDCGHVDARALGGGGGFQPEHAGCNRTHGARLGNALRATRRGPRTSRQW